MVTQTNTNARFGRMGHVVVMLGLCMALGACVKTTDRILFNGVFYKAKSKAADKNDRQNFVVTVPRVDRGFDGAVQAGAYEARRYCIENFGTSEIIWAQGPDGATQRSIPVEGNKITFTGRCHTW